MAGRSSPRRLSAVVAAVLPARAHRSLRRRLGRRLGIPGADSGLVSVVVVCETVDLARLGDALASVLGQSHALLEVLVCPVGPAVEGLGPLVEHVTDVRLRVRAEQPTWAAAATAGAHAAHGDFVCFLRGCDLLPPDAIARGAASLAASGSALSCGRLEQAGEPEPWLERAQRDAHAEPGTGLAPDARPALAGDLVVGTKLIRRAAWLGGHGFGPDDDWLVSPAIAALLGSVDRVDVLADATYIYAPDHGTRAFGATPDPLPGLPAWTHRVRAVGQALVGSPLADAWARHVAAVELPRLLQEAERATDEQWDGLQALAASYADRPGLLRELPATARALVWLAAHDRRAAVEALGAEATALGDDVPTSVHGTAVLAQWRVPGLDLPPDVRRLTETETSLRTHVQRVRGTADEREADVLVELRYVDLGDPVPVVDAWTDDGDELPVQHLPGTEATRWAGRRHQRAVAVRVRVPGDGAVSLLLALTAGGVVRTGRVVVPPRTSTTAAAPVTVRGLRLDGTSLVVTADGDLERLRLLDPAGRPLDVPTDRPPGSARIELRTDRFGTPTWLGPGAHRLVTDTGNVGVAEELRDLLPLELPGERHRLRAHLGPLGGLVLGIGAPLTDDELGPWAQERLREHYARSTAAVDPDVFYFESYAGRTATDSPLAILEELRRRRPGLTAYWGIADHSQRAPDGATPVLLRSREWYDVLARAGCLVTNTDVEAWFRRRPGQFLLQTFHGYPSKAMGLGQWRALDYGPSRIRTFRARGVDTWSAILTPTPEMTRHYREQYSYEGPALERGYPRDDDLVGDVADRRRAETRRRLGIADHQTAVLYAPTWREHLASRPRAAAMTDHLDVATAVEALGDDHVLLLRGHRFHAPDVADPRVLDVTAYPEINDLVLASDAAVLDYSSLRFDYALTGKPMVFLVPDLEEYDAGSRSFLFPFAESAPGPFVRDTAGVVAELRDLEGLRARHAEAIAAFNATYHPWQDGRAAARVVDGLLALR